MPLCYLPLSELVSHMNGCSSTNGWDVVCSYNVKQLNAILQAQYDQGKLVKNLKVNLQIENPMGPDFPPYERSYQLKLASPKLSFNQTIGFVTLTMPIMEGVSTTWSHEDASQQVTVRIPPDAYSIQAEVPLVVVKGGEDPTPDDPKGPHEVIDFHDNVVDHYHIIIHFRNEQSQATAFSIISHSTSADDSLQSDLTKNILPWLKTYFMTQVKEIDYSLSLINNAIPTSGEVMLTPKSFVFSSLGANEEGVLSLYIQTIESGNGRGIESPLFRPGDYSTYPIPAGYSASVILSNALIKKVFLERELVKSGFDVQFHDGTKGITAALRKNVSVIAADENHKSMAYNDSYEGLNVSLAAYPITLQIDEGKLTLSWRGETSSKWYSHTSGSDISQYGRVDLTLSFAKGPIDISLRMNDVIRADAVVSRSDFRIDTHAGGCDFWDKMSGCSEVVPRFYKNDMQLSVPPISLSLPGLNFFSTTNLLGPEQYVIDLDRNAGVKTPCDFLLVGDMVKASASSANLADLVNRMNVRPTTNGREIVYSYPAQLLNEFLEKKYDANKFKKDVEFRSATQYPYVGHIITTYQLKLASPKLVFVPPSFVWITIPVKAGTCSSARLNDQQNIQTVSIPENEYRIQAMFPFAAVAGAGSFGSGGSVIEFHDGLAHDDHVVIRFTKGNGTFFQVGSDSGSTVLDTSMMFLQNLGGYLNSYVGGIDYSLSSLTDVFPSSEKMERTPNSFTIHSSGTEEDGIVVLSIQT